jgi:hypothetical protein
MRSNLTCVLAIIFIGVLSFFGWAFFELNHPPAPAEAERILKLAESFKTQYSRYPNTLSEIDSFAKIRNLPPIKYELFDKLDVHTDRPETCSLKYVGKDLFGSQIPGNCTLYPPIR